MKNQSVYIRDEDGFFINSFEFKPIDGKLTYVCCGSDSRVGATFWDSQMALAIVAFLRVYGRAVYTVPAY